MVHALDRSAAASGTYLAVEPILKLPPASHWLWATCLVGVDYFSTLAYQVSYTVRVAGPLGPLATLGIVLVTLLGALPVYLYLAGRSPAGQSSLALLEKLVDGWLGKTLVLLVLGFAATDFVVTKTLSTAAAAQHVIQNDSPAWQEGLNRAYMVVHDALAQYASPAVAAYFKKQLLVTLLLGLLSFLFWAMIRRGFNRKATVGAVLVVTAYLALNGVVIGSGLWHLGQHPELLARWWTQLFQEGWHGTPLADRGDAWLLAVGVIVLFPKLALGLSGLEMTVVAMPEVAGSPGDDAERPRTRIRNARKVMVTAAVIMCCYLFASVLVATILIPSDEFAVGGKAADRALAYLAHGGPIAGGNQATVLNPLFGRNFGAIYDLATVLILCLAGTSVITGLTTLLPQVLLKFGMQLRWVQAYGVLFALLALVNFGITLLFHASVDDQRGAYTAGVLVLIANAATVSVVDRWRRSQRVGLGSVPWGYALIALVFWVTTVAVIIEHPSGLLIALCFIVVILATSIVSRALRSNELRTVSLEMIDERSEQLWRQLEGLSLPVLVPHRPGRHERAAKAVAMREEHQLAADADLVFIEIHVDDPSDFYQRLRVGVFQEDHRYVVQVFGCVSVPHAVAAVALALCRDGKRPALHFGWSELGPLAAAWNFLAFGEGNIPHKVRELVRRSESDPGRRPRIVVG